MSVFLRAINIINKHGWTKGKYRRYTQEDTAKFGTVNAGYCILGACAGEEPSSTIGEFEDSKQYKILREVCRVSPIYYNDNLAKSKQDIINILQKAYEYECELAKQTEHSFALPA